MCGSTESFPNSVLKRDCCPCPNKNVINEVEDYLNSQATSAGSWDMMCKQYQRETNKTIDCWQ